MESGERIELYRGVGLVPAGSLDSRMLFRAALERILGRQVNDLTLRVALLPYHDDFIPEGAPLMYNLLPQFGYAEVQVHEQGQIYYRHPHPLGELIGRTLQEQMRRDYPEESQWGYRIAGPGI